MLYKSSINQFQAMYWQSLASLERSSSESNWLPQSWTSTIIYHILVYHLPSSCLSGSKFWNARVKGTIFVVIPEIMHLLNIEQMFTWLLRDALLGAEGTMLCFLLSLFFSYEAYNLEWYKWLSYNMSYVLSRKSATQCILIAHVFPLQQNSLLNQAILPKRTLINCPWVKWFSVNFALL